MKLVKQAIHATIAVLLCVPFAHAQHVSDGLIAEYNFNEGSGDTVNDGSGFGTPLNLTIRDADNVTWGSGFLSIDTSTVLESLVAATKLNDSLALGAEATHEISIEAYVKPANNTQGGASRLVNIGTFDPSEDGSRNRNVFLAQDRTNYDARLRTTTTGDNGASPQQQTDPNAPILESPTLTHVVFTRDTDGNSLIYVDGIDLSVDTVLQDGDLSNWDDTYGLTIANEKNYDDAGARDFLGELHHVSIYSRALTAAEVTQNLNSFASTGSEPGDYDATGAVGQGDLDLVLLNWGSTAPPIPTGWVNEQPSGLIGQTNLDGVLLNWGNGSITVATSVPEPTSVMLLSIAGALCCLRRR